MKITNIETIPVNVPVRGDVMITSSLGSHTHSPFLLVKVHTNEGVTGLGEVSSTARWSGEDHATARRVIAEYLAPALVGGNPLDIEAGIRVMGRALAGNPFTKAGLELALWDILGKAAGLPLFRLLGGAVRDIVPLKFSISGAAPEKAAALAHWAGERGFKTMKVKVAWGGMIWTACAWCASPLAQASGWAWTPMAGGLCAKRFKCSAGCALMISTSQSSLCRP